LSRGRRLRRRYAESEIGVKSDLYVKTQGLGLGFNLCVAPSPVKQGVLEFAEVGDRSEVGEVGYNRQSLIVVSR
jgi:hypothetical protein